MIRLDYMDGRSLHEQIEDGIKSLIISRVMTENEQLPSVRELSVSLTVNPNTVQRAYKQLEADGFIYSIKGKGNFVASVKESGDENRIAELYKSVKDCVKELLYLGKTEEEIQGFISEIKEEYK